MLFCSREFLLFFVAVFALYWAIPWHRPRVGLLLAASFVFYASWNHWLALLICASTLMNYLIARGLEASHGRGIRRFLLGTSLAANLGMLGYFKYANFFLGSVQQALHAMGTAPSFPVLQVILPIGISFSTFEAISYTVDVYRRRIPAERSLPHFMLFILFFPHLIAGPIVRARDFLPQVRRRKRWSWPRLNLGAQLFLLGLFKKIAIADRMALLADPVFADADAYRTTALWLATLAWAIQVYCDFSGYTDMALGCAHMLGYKLAPNFNLPYLAPNISEFWRRWHISLSTWLRDYLFIPLGGSRGSRWQTARNLLVTMTLGGLWHGAGWPYVVFGTIHGLLLTVHREFRTLCKHRPRLDQLLRTPPGTAVRIALTFTVFCLTLVIFRAPTLAAARGMLRNMMARHNGLPLPMPELALWYAVAIIAVSHVVAGRDRWQRIDRLLPSPVRGLGYALVLSAALLLSPSAYKAFVYFQF